MFGSCVSVAYYAVKQSNSGYVRPNPGIDIINIRILQRTLKATDINQIVVGDVTAYDIQGRDHYCAMLMDRLNREVIGKAVRHPEQ